MPLFLLSLSAITSVLGPSNGTLLVQVPMIMVHDSGSGYLPEKGVVDKWARTQSVGMAQQWNVALVHLMHGRCARQ